MSKDNELKHIQHIQKNPKETTEIFSLKQEIYKIIYYLVKLKLQGKVSTKSFNTCGEKNVNVSKMLESVVILWDRVGFCYCNKNIRKIRIFTY